MSQVSNGLSSRAVLMAVMVGTMVAVLRKAREHVISEGFTEWNTGELFKPPILTEAQMQLLQPSMGQLLVLNNQLLAIPNGNAHQAERAAKQAEIVLEEQNIVRKGTMEKGQRDVQKASVANQQAYSKLCTQLTDLMEKHRPGLTNSLTANKGLGHGATQVSIHTALAALGAQATAEAAQLNVITKTTELFQQITASQTMQGFYSDSGTKFQELCEMILAFRQYLKDLAGPGGVPRFSDADIRLAIEAMVPGTPTGETPHADALRAIAEGNLEAFIAQAQQVMTLRASQPGVPQRPASHLAAPAINSPHGGSAAGGAGGGAGAGRGGGGARRLASSYTIDEKLTFARESASGSHAQACPLHGTSHALAGCDVMFDFAAATSCPAAFLQKLEQNRVARNAFRQSQGKGHLPVALPSTN